MPTTPPIACSERDSSWHEVDRQLGEHGALEASRQGVAEHQQIDLEHNRRRSTRSASHPPNGAHASTASRAPLGTVHVASRRREWRRARRSRPRRGADHSGAERTDRAARPSRATAARRRGWSVARRRRAVRGRRSMGRAMDDDLVPLQRGGTCQVGRPAGRGVARPRVPDGRPRVPVRGPGA